MGRQMSSGLCGALVCTFPVSCGVPGTGAVSGTSGLQGVTLRGPVCPGPVRIPPDPKCDDAPFPTPLIVSTNNGMLVARFTTAQDGTFRIGLAPGTYTLSSDQAVIMGPLTPLQVTVTDQAFTTVELHFDSGIR